MRAIEVMMQEHRLIEKVLDALDAFARRVQRDKLGDAATRATLANFVAFIANFADRLHHGKEEDILFTALGDFGFPPDDGPVGMMLYEHNEGRAYVGIMRGHAQAVQDWTDADRGEAMQAANAFSALLRAHIQKEDHVLYRMAAQVLPPDVQRDINQRCAAKDDELAADRAKYEKLAGDLATEK